jgi:hypothetical protein
VTKVLNFLFTRKNVGACHPGVVVVFFFFFFFFFSSSYFSSYSSSSSFFSSYYCSSSSSSFFFFFFFFFYRALACNAACRLIVLTLCFGSSRQAPPRIQRCERPLAGKGGTMGEK